MVYLRSVPNFGVSGDCIGITALENIVWLTRLHGVHTRSGTQSLGAIAVLHV